MQRFLLISLLAQSVKNLPAVLESLVRFLGREDLLRYDTLSTPVFWGFPCGSAGRESACNVGDLGSTPGLGRCPGGGKGYPLQDSGLENSMDSIVHGVTKSQTWVSDFHFLHIYIYIYLHLQCSIYYILFPMLLFKKFLFIYFWLCWVFPTARELFLVSHATFFT